MDTFDDTASSAQPSLVTRAGLLLGGGAVVAMICALSPALRGDGAFGSRWLAATAMMAPATTLLIALFGRARLGIRLLTHDEAEATISTIAGAFALFALPLAMAAYVLAAKTHHHALAGVTFAIASSGLGLAAIFVSRRLAEIFARGDEARAHRWLAFARIAAAIGVAAPILFAACTLSGTSRSAVASMAFDCGLLFVASWIASGVRVSGRRTFARVGLPLWILLALLGSRVQRSVVDDRVPTTLGALAPWVR